MVDPLITVVVIVVFHWLHDCSLPSPLSSTSKVDWVYFVGDDNTAFDINVKLKTRDRPNLTCKDMSRG